MIELFNCIPMEYVECLSAQRKLNTLRNEGTVGDLIIATEHEDTYTAGIHFNMDNAGKYSVPIIGIERGGSLTYHGRGQLVLYFIFNLKERGINVKQMIEKVQGAINGTLSSYNLKGEGRLFKETGVWVNGRKICSIGFAIRGFSTLHGIALNINTDLAKFYKIDPCDSDPGVMTSVEKETGKKVDEGKFLQMLVSELSGSFNDRIEWNGCNSLKDYLFYI
jgi:lipoyl(octanoyl) transferase